jgi:hypothetical protein
MTPLLSDAPRAGLRVNPWSCAPFGAAGTVPVVRREDITAAAVARHPRGAPRSVEQHFDPGRAVHRERMAERP